MEWETLEHQYTEKTNDWYASVILISGALIAVEFLTNNFLLITLTLIATATFILLSARRPEMMRVEILPKGVLAGNEMYSYHSLDAFAIVEYHHENRLLLESNRHIMPLIVIPIPHDVSTDEIREVLRVYLDEKELHESFAQLLLERLGF